MRATLCISTESGIAGVVPAPLLNAVPLFANSSLVNRSRTVQLENQGETRENEFYVPRFGPKKFRMLVGLSFFPYTLKNASYVVIGSLLASPVHYDRMAEMALVYLLAVGISAHSLDAMSPNKPWGDFLTKRQLLAMAVGGLVPALALGLYLSLSFAPLLIPLGLVELFFLLAYNLEFFSGRFHSDLWFSLSWGYLPLLAGFVVQSDAVTAPALIGGLFGFFTAFVEINASRPYKALKRQPGGAYPPLVKKLESILKGVVLSVLAAAAALLALALTR